MYLAKRAWKLVPGWATPCLGPILLINLQHSLTIHNCMSRKVGYLL